MTQPTQAAQTQTQEAGADLAKQLADLQAKLALTEQAKADAEKAAKLAKRRQPAERPAAAPQKLTREQELEMFANEKAREAEVLRTAMEFGLEEEELLDGEWSTPTELRLAAQVKKLEKNQTEHGQSSAALQSQIAQLLEQQKKVLTALQTGEVPEEPTADTGGPSGQVARNSRAQKLQDLRTARDKARPRSAERQWLTLQAIYADPEKVIRTGPPTEE